MHSTTSPPFRPHLVVLATLIALSSCGGGSGGESAQPSTSVTQRPIALSDLDIAQRIYAGSPRTPAGFRTDAAPSGFDRVSTEHLKSTDISGMTQAAPQEYELCTNDWNEAYTWSETTAQSASVYAHLIETPDDSRYFEFGRVPENDPQVYARTRVFKCAYVDRSEANLLADSGPAGTLNQRPLTADDLAALSEYLWQFTSYNNYGHAVLASSGAPTSLGLEHTLLLASLTRKGASETCDRVEVIEWRHEVDAATGELQLDVRTLWSFGARENAGVAALCER